MAERLNNTIETQINDGNTIVSQIVDNNQPLQTVIQDVPQVQTVLQNGINVSSQINAPFVEVTSVNGKTGDVITEPVVGVFEPNHYYLENTMIGHNNNLYYAKETFTSGSSFNANDWYSVEGSQITVDSALSTTSENPVQNKVITTKINEIDRFYRGLVPLGTAIAANKNLNTTEFLKVGKYYCSLNATVATLTNCPTGSAFMMEVFSPLSTTIDNEATSRWVYRIRILTTNFGKMYIQRANSGSTAGNFTYGAWEQFAYTDNIGNGTLTIQRNGTNIQTFTANQSGNATANISVPTKTSDITNDSGFITKIPTASASTLGGIKVGGGLNIANTGVLSTELSIEDGSTVSTVIPSITTSQIVDEAVTASKIDWDSILERLEKTVTLDSTGNANLNILAADYWIIAIREYGTGTFKNAHLTPYTWSNGYYYVHGDMNYNNAYATGGINIEILMIKKSAIGM